jgi:hypothetical protein
LGNALPPLPHMQNPASSTWLFLYLEGTPIISTDTG